MAGAKLIFAASVLLLALLFSFGFQPSEERPLNFADKPSTNNILSSPKSSTYVVIKTAQHVHHSQKAGALSAANNGGSSAAALDADINDTSPGHSPGVGHSSGPSSGVGPKA